VSKSRLDTLLTFHKGCQEALATLYGPPVPEAERNACALALGRPDLIPDPPRLTLEVKA
jgi:hypothetical protein